MLNFLLLAISAATIAAESIRNLQAGPANGLELISGLTIGVFAEDENLGPDCGLLFSSLELTVQDPVQDGFFQSRDFSIDSSFEVVPFGLNCSLINFNFPTNTSISLDFTLSAQAFGFTVPDGLVVPSVEDCVADSSSLFPNPNFLPGLCNATVELFLELADLLGDNELVDNFSRRPPPVGIEQAIDNAIVTVDGILEAVPGTFEGAAPEPFEATLETIGISIEISPVVTGINDNIEAIINTIRAVQEDPVTGGIGLVTVITVNIPTLFDIITGLDFEEEIVPIENLQDAIGSLALFFINGFFQNPEAEPLSEALQVSFAQLIGIELEELDNQTIAVIDVIARATVIALDGDFDNQATQNQLFLLIDSIVEDPALSINILTALNAAITFFDDRDFFAFAQGIAGLGGDPETVAFLQGFLTFTEAFIDGTLFIDPVLREGLFNFTFGLTGDVELTFDIITGLGAFGLFLDNNDFFAFAQTIVSLGNDNATVAELQFILGFLEAFVESEDMFGFAFNNSAVFAFILGTEQAVILDTLNFLVFLQLEGVGFLFSNLGQAIDLISTLVGDFIASFDGDDYYDDNNNTDTYYGGNMTYYGGNMTYYGHDNNTGMYYYEGEVNFLGLILEFANDLLGFDVLETFYYVEDYVDSILNLSEGDIFFLILEIFGLDFYDFYGFDPYNLTGFDPYNFTGFDPYNFTGFDPFNFTGFDPAQLFTVGVVADLIDIDFFSALFSVVDNSTSIFDFKEAIEFVPFGELRAAFADFNVTLGLEIIAFIEIEVNSTAIPFDFLPIGPIVEAIVEQFFIDLEQQLQNLGNEVQSIDFVELLTNEFIAILLEEFGIVLSEAGLVIAEFEFPGFGVQEVVLSQFVATPSLVFGEFDESKGAFLLPSVDLAFNDVSITLVTLGQVFTITSSFSVSAIQGLLLLVNNEQLANFGFGAWTTIPGGIDVFSDLATCALSSVAATVNVRSVISSFLLNFDAISVAPGLAPDLTDGFIEDVIDFAVELYTPAIPTIVELAPFFLFQDVPPVFFFEDGVAVCAANPFVEPPVNTNAPTPAPTDGDDDDGDDGDDVEDEIPVEIVIPAAIGGVALAAAAGYLVFSGGAVAGAAAAGAGGAAAAGAGGAAAGEGGAAAAGGAAAEKAAADPVAAKVAAAEV